MGHEELVGADPAEAPLENDEVHEGLAVPHHCDGAEVVIECSGNTHAVAGAAELACPGGCLVYVGCPVPTTIDIGMQQVRELRTESVFRCVFLLWPRLAGGREDAASWSRPGGG